MLKLYNKLRPYIIVLAVVVLSTLVAWAPFLFRQTNWLGLRIDNANFQYIYRNFDGPLYIVPAKTLYNPQEIAKIGLELPLSPGYFAAHLPLYPILIRLFAPLLGYLKSMILVNLVATTLLACIFYYIIEKLNISKNPLLLTSLLLFLPRFLVVRSVGAPESLFIFLILLSLYFFEKQDYLLAGIFGGLSAMTKTPGILLFAAYALTLGERYISGKKIEWRSIGIFLIPFGFFLVFLLYANQYGDFFAYFKSGDNIHLIAPYSAFNFHATWVGTAWLEDIVFYFFLYALTVVSLKDFKYRSFFYFALIFFTATLFVQHRDIARYSLSLWPLALIAFERFFSSKKTLIAFLILLPAIYMYAWNFMSYNVMPISNWAPFL